MQPMFNGGHAHTHDGGHEHSHGNSGPAVDLVLELNGEWQAEQEANDISDPNSGGNKIFLSPGLRLSRDEWSGFVSLGIPVVDDLNGIQSEPDWRVLAGGTLLFEPGLGAVATTLASSWPKSEDWLSSASARQAYPRADEPPSALPPS